MNPALVSLSRLRQRSVLVTAVDKNHSHLHFILHMLNALIAPDIQPQRGLQIIHRKYARFLFPESCMEIMEASDLSALEDPCKIQVVTVRKFQNATFRLMN